MKIVQLHKCKKQTIQHCGRRGSIMAIIYEGKNQLGRQTKRYLINCVFFAIILIWYYLRSFTYGFWLDGFYNLLPIPFLAWPMLYYYEKYKILRVGVQGEKQALRGFSMLSNQYHVLNNVPCAFDGQLCEIDLLVVGPNGVFVIEVKNHNGTIKGESEAPVWNQQKVGRQGGEYSKRIRNPIKQMKRSIYILSKYMEVKGIKQWIDGVVYFPNPEVCMMVEAENVYDNEALVIEHIKSFAGKKQLSKDEIKRIVTLLIKSKE